MSLLASTAAKLQVLDVVGALISNPRGELLLTQRPPGKSDAGLWEFPGGKIEAGEDPHVALARELAEELGISLHTSYSLQATVLDDPEQNLRLRMQFRRAEQWSGQPLGLEGQALRWVSPNRVHRLLLTRADRLLARDLALPPHYVISPEPSDERGFLDALERTLLAGERLLLLRVKTRTLSALRRLATLCRDRVAHYGGELLLQDNFELAELWRFGGVSLSSAALMRLRTRKLPAQWLLGASCHSPAELKHAQALGCDFVTLAPVLATTSHPQTTPLGWPRFRELIEGYSLPVYALGGQSAGSYVPARTLGAHGVAGIGQFWR